MSSDFSMDDFDDFDNNIPINTNISTKDLFEGSDARLPLANSINSTIQSLYLPNSFMDQPQMHQMHQQQQQQQQQQQYYQMPLNQSHGDYTNLGRSNNLTPRTNLQQSMN
ncbi:hypothetical protein CYY_008404, partial [Polysphondylium violaceum]